MKVKRIPCNGGSPRQSPFSREHEAKALQRRWILSKSEYEIGVWVPGAKARGIQTGQIATCWAIFVLIYFSNLCTFIPQCPLPCYPRKMRKWKYRNLSEIQCPWHSNWTICSLLSQFCSQIFSNFFTFILEGQFLLPQAENGKKEFSQPEWDRRVWVHGVFKLDCLQPVKPILVPKFSNFFTFILEGQFLLPQAENGQSGYLPTWVRHKGLSAWGIQIGPFATY